MNKNKTLFGLLNLFVFILVSLSVTADIYDGSDGDYSDVILSGLENDGLDFVNLFIDAGNQIQKPSSLYDQVNNNLFALALIANLDTYSYNGKKLIAMDDLPQTTCDTDYTDRSCLNTNNMVSDTGNCISGKCPPPFPDNVRCCLNTAKFYANQDESSCGDPAGTDIMDIKEKFEEGGDNDGVGADGWSCIEGERGYTIDYYCLASVDYTRTNWPGKKGCSGTKLCCTDLPKTAKLEGYVLGEHSFTNSMESFLDPLADVEIGLYKQGKADSPYITTTDASGFFSFEDIPVFEGDGWAELGYSVVKLRKKIFNVDAYYETKVIEYVPLIKGLNQKNFEYPTILPKTTLSFSFSKPPGEMCEVDININKKPHQPDFLVNEHLQLMGFTTERLKSFDLEHGEYTYSISSPGCGIEGDGGLNYEGEVVLDYTNVNIPVLLITRSAIIKGTVVIKELSFQDEGATVNPIPIEGANVSIISSSSSSIAYSSSESTGKGGYFEMNVLPGTTYTLIVKKDKYLPYTSDPYAMSEGLILSVGNIELIGEENLIADDDVILKIDPTGSEIHKGQIMKADVIFTTDLSKGKKNNFYLKIELERGGETTDYVKNSGHIWEDNSSNFQDGDKIIISLMHDSGLFSKAVVKTTKTYNIKVAKSELIIDLGREYMSITWEDVTILEGTEELTSEYRDKKHYISDLSEGTHTLTFKKPGFEDNITSVTIPTDGSDVTIEVTLNGKSGVFDCDREWDKTVKGEFTKLINCEGEELMISVEVLTEGTFESMLVGGYWSEDGNTYLGPNRLDGNVNINVINMQHSDLVIDNAKVGMIFPGDYSGELTINGGEIGDVTWDNEGNTQKKIIIQKEINGVLKSKNWKDDNGENLITSNIYTTAIWDDEDYFWIWGTGGSETDTSGDSWSDVSFEFKPPTGNYVAKGDDIIITMKQDLLSNSKYQIKSCAHPDDKILVQSFFAEKQLVINTDNECFEESGKETISFIIYKASGTRYDTIEETEEGNKMNYTWYVTAQQNDFFFKLKDEDGDLYRINEEEVEILIDGEKKETKLLREMVSSITGFIENVPAGDHTVTFRKLGYKNESKTITIIANKAHTKLEDNPVVLERNPIYFDCDLDTDYNVDKTEYTTLLHCDTNDIEISSSTVKLSSGAVNKITIGKDNIDIILNPDLDASEVDVLSGGKVQINIELDNNPRSIDPESSNPIISTVYPYVKEIATAPGEWHIWGEKELGILEVTVNEKDLDGTDKGPLEGVTIDISKMNEMSGCVLNILKTGITDASGKYIFTDLEEEKYCLQARKANYSIDTITSQLIIAGQSNNYAFSLKLSQEIITAGDLYFTNSPILGETVDKDQYIVIEYKDPIEAVFFKITEGEDMEYMCGAIHGSGGNCDYVETGDNNKVVTIKQELDHGEVITVAPWQTVGGCLKKITEQICPFWRWSIEDFEFVSLNLLKQQGDEIQKGEKHIYNKDYDMKLRARWTGSVDVGSAEVYIGTSLIHTETGLSGRDTEYDITIPLNKLTGESGDISVMVKLKDKEGDEIKNNKGEFLDFSTYQLTDKITMEHRPGMQTISGKVTNVKDNGEISGITIKAMRGTSEIESTTSRNDGTYGLYLESGKYNIEFSSTEYDTFIFEDIELFIGNDLTDADVKLLEVEEFACDGNYNDDENGKHKLVTGKKILLSSCDTKLITSSEDVNIQSGKADKVTVTGGTLTFTGAESNKVYVEGGTFVLDGNDVKDEIKIEDGATVVINNEVTSKIFSKKENAVTGTANYKPVGPITNGYREWLKTETIETKDNCNITFSPDPGSKVNWGESITVELIKGINAGSQKYDLEITKCGETTTRDLSETLIITADDVCIGDNDEIEVKVIDTNWFDGVEKDVDGNKMEGYKWIIIKDPMYLSLTAEEAVKFEDRVEAKLEVELLKDKCDSLNSKDVKIDMGSYGQEYEDFLNIGFIDFEFSVECEKDSKVEPSIIENQQILKAQMNLLWNGLKDDTSTLIVDQLVTGVINGWGTVIISSEDEQIKDIADKFKSGDEQKARTDLLIMLLSKTDQEQQAIRIKFLVELTK